MIGASDRIGLGAFWPVDVAEPYHVARVFATLDHLPGDARPGWRAWSALQSWARSSAISSSRRRRRMRRRGRPSSSTLHANFGIAGRIAASSSTRRAARSQTRRMCYPIEHAGRYFAVRGPLNVPRPIQGQPVILHCDVPPGPARTAAAASAELVLAGCATIPEAQALRAAWKALAGGSWPRSPTDCA